MLLIPATNTSLAHDSTWSMLHLRVGHPWQIWSQERPQHYKFLLKENHCLVHLSLLFFLQVLTLSAVCGLFALDMLWSYVNVSPTKCKTQCRGRCGAGVAAEAAVRIRAQDYRITRWTTWTGRWWKRRGEGRHGLSRVLKHKREITRKKLVFKWC